MVARGSSYQDTLLEKTQWDFFWLPARARVVERPELLYAITPEGRPGQNVVTRTRAEDSELSALVDEVTRAHQGEHSRWMLVPSCDSTTLRAALAHADYHPGPEHFAYVLDVADFVPRTVASFVVRQVQTRQELLDWLAVSAQAFGQPTALDEASLALELSRCTGTQARVSRFVAYDPTGEAVSAGGMNLYPSLAFGFLWAGGTIPKAQGKGAYSAIVAARVRHARTLGLQHLGLYARHDTSAPIVAKQGFARHGLMQFWDRPCG